jgi:hypothetical protein
MRALTLTAAIALVAFAGACTKPAHVDGLAQPANPAPTTTSASPAPAVTSAAPRSSSPPATPAGTTTAKTSKPVDDHCPASGRALLTALRQSEIYARAGHPDGITTPSCYQGFAYARSAWEVEPQHEQPWILFKFDSKAGRWKPVNLGTAGVCEGYAPQAVSDHLGGGC